MFIQVVDCQNFNFKGALEPSEMPQQNAPPRHFEDFTGTSVIYRVNQHHEAKLSRMLCTAHDGRHRFDECAAIPRGIPVDSVGLAFLENCWPCARYPSFGLLCRLSVRVAAFEASHGRFICGQLSFSRVVKMAQHLGLTLNVEGEAA